MTTAASGAEHESDCVCDFSHYVDNENDNENDNNCIICPNGYSTPFLNSISILSCSMCPSSLPFVSSGVTSGGVCAFPALELPARFQAASPGDLLVLAPGSLNVHDGISSSAVLSFRDKHATIACESEIHDHNYNYNYTCTWSGLPGQRGQSGSRLHELPIEGVSSKCRKSVVSVIRAGGAGDVTTFSKISIRDGYLPVTQGGGMYIQESSVNLQVVKFQYSYARLGGAIAVRTFPGGAPFEVRENK